MTAPEDLIPSAWIDLLLLLPKASLSSPSVIPKKYDAGTNEVLAGYKWEAYSRKNFMKATMTVFDDRGGKGITTQTVVVF